jgi:hypothetical protein
MSEQEIFMFIANNGVAVFVLVWFMFRMEKVINNNTKAVNEVKNVVSKCPQHTF